MSSFGFSFLICTLVIVTSLSVPAFSIKPTESDWIETGKICDDDFPSRQTRKDAHRDGKFVVTLFLVRATMMIILVLKWGALRATLFKIIASGHALCGDATAGMANTPANTGVSLARHEESTFFQKIIDTRQR